MCCSVLQHCQGHVLYLLCGSNVRDGGCVAAMCEMVVGVRRSDTRRKEEMPELELLVTQDA